MTILKNLLVAVLKRKDTLSFSLITREWVPASERKVYDYIRVYFKEYGELPEIDLFADKFKLTVDPKYPRAATILQLTKELENNFIVDSLVRNVPEIMSSVDKDPREAIRELGKLTQNLQSRSTISEVTFRGRATSRAAAYDARVATKGITYLSTGSAVLDSIMYGWKETDMLTMGGRAGAGKTWLLLLLAMWVEASVIEKFPDREVLIVSNEMPEDEILERMDCIRFKLPYGDFMSGSLTRAQRRSYSKGLEVLETSKSCIRIVYNVATIDELDALMGIYNPAIVFVDSSYLMEAHLGEGWERATAVTRGLRGINLRRKIPIVNNTQLRRASGKKEHKVSVDDQDEFAYTQSYIQDSTIAWRMFQSPEMIFRAETGVSFAKGRRVKPGTVLTFINNLATMELDICLAEEIPEEKPLVW